MDYNNNTDINKNVMGWIPINNDVSISQAKYPRLVAYIKQNFQVNKVYWDVVGGVRLVNASGLYPRFIGSHWTGFTTNSDAPWAQCGDKIDYANISQLKNTIIGLKYPRYTMWGIAGGGDGAISFIGNGNKEDYPNINVSRLDYLYNPSYKETRPKTIFMNLLIYAGYPQIL